MIPQTRVNDRRVGGAGYQSERGVVWTKMWIPIAIMLKVLPLNAAVDYSADETSDGQRDFITARVQYFVGRLLNGSKLTHEHASNFH